MCCEVTQLRTRARVLENRVLESNMLQGRLVEILGQLREFVEIGDYNVELYGGSE
jgi:hypothetical protein